ncbi:MAG: hypothetical protein H7099_16050 [Gemmatimonadaceae bacterium]|nr:hypothetical protein [Gemmatimonadaceae bacterium]
MPSMSHPRGYLSSIVGASVAFGALVAVALVMKSRELPTLAPTLSREPLVTFSATPLSEAAIRDRDITFYIQRVKEDSTSAIDRLALAGLLYARARITGSTSDLEQSEMLARESVGIREARNGQAYEVLASTLMARHAFREAHAVAVTADSLEPDTPSHLALLGEIELELGDYDAAAAHFRAVHYDGTQFTIGARVARWYEVTGHVDIAREMLRRAIVSADRRDDLPREQAAWFHYRLGELELRMGRVAAAESSFVHGLRKNPEDVRILGGLARAALARGDWRHAADFGEQAISIQLDPATLGTISRAYAALGDTAQAARYADAMSRSALTQPGAIHRAWGQFLLDHGTPSDRADVLRRARRELRDRHDVYGHDLLAWALYRNGYVEEAAAEMKLALSQHTEDTMLAEHGRILAAAVATQ